MEGFRIDTLAVGYKEAVGVQHKLAKVGCTDLRPNGRHQKTEVDFRCRVCRPDTQSLLLNPKNARKPYAINLYTPNPLHPNPLFSV